MTKDQLAKINEAQAYIQASTNIKPMCGLILGSGLGELADALDDFFYIEYKDIPHFPVSSAPSHKGRLCFGYLSGVPLVLMQGRVHTYEGYTPQDVAFPVYVMKPLGIQNVVLTNAAGGLKKSVNSLCVLIIYDCPTVKNVFLFIFIPQICYAVLLPVWFAQLYVEFFLRSRLIFTAVIQITKP